MQPLQNRNKPNSIGEAFIQDRYVGDNDKDASKNLIGKANTADMMSVLKWYGINLDEYNKKCICPFHFHSNENSPSFVFYKNTNSFYCFGCKSGGGPVNFVSLMDDISREDASKKIAYEFSINNDSINPKKSFVGRQDLILEFSAVVRKFIHENLDDKDILTITDEIGLIFDTINSRHYLDNVGLKSLIEKLKVKLKAINR